MQDIRPPVIAVWDPDAGGYVQASADVCVARWSTDHPGILCGQEVFRRVGGASFCAHHYDRVLDSHASIVRQEDRESGWSLDGLQDAPDPGWPIDARQWEPDAAEVVYYIQRKSDGLIKIGTSGEFRVRLTHLRAVHGTLRILLTHRGGRDFEDRMHSKFHHLRVRGEWFSPESALADWILEVRWWQRKIGTGRLSRGTVTLRDIENLAEAARRGLGTSRSKPAA